MSSRNTKTYIFVCSKLTQEECLSRLLMGGKAGKHSYVKTDQVKVDDVIFLYNYQTGKLFGEFVATSNSQTNIITQAWKGDFPMQVKVRLAKDYVPLSKNDILHFIRFRGPYPPKTISPSQLAVLRQSFRSSKRALQEEIDYRLEKPGTIITDDGHWVRSYDEQTIDNWLYAHDICHAYEVPLPNATYHCDFYIPRFNLYIEYWGMDDEKYLERMKHKQKYYADHKLHLLDLYPKDMHNIDHSLQNIILDRR